MRTGFLAALGVVMVVGFACAKQAAPDPAGPTSTASSSSGSGGAGGGPVCDDQPCTLLEPQCGCKDGDKCTINPETTFPNKRVCATAGLRTDGQTCVNDDECAVGYVCLQETMTINTCNKFCATDADCISPGGACLVTLTDNMGQPIPAVAVCTENCDPATSTECVQGAACRLIQNPNDPGVYVTQCSLAGNEGQGVPCLTSDDCTANHVCVADQGGLLACRQYCKVADGLGCPVATTCNGFMPAVTLGTIEYGVCI